MATKVRDGASTAKLGGSEATFTGFASGQKAAVDSGSQEAAPGFSGLIGVS